VGSGAENEVEIGTEAQEEGQLNVNRQDMQDVLNAKWGQTSGKLDFKNASQSALAERLRDPLARAGVALSEVQLQKLAKDTLDFRDTPPRSGLVTNFSQLASVAGVNPGIMNTLQQEWLSGAVSHLKVEMVGPKVGAELRTRPCWHALRARRDAGVHLVPVRVDLRLAP